MQLKLSQCWNYHILLVTVFINTALSGEQFSNMNLKLLEAFIFVNSVIPLLRLYLKI